jgi:hypothetical protein
MYDKQDSSRIINADIILLMKMIILIKDCGNT